MANCAYHPDARGTATCPTCQKFICDRCRLNGNSQRCGTCQSVWSKGGTDDARTKRTMCLNHAATPTDMFCKSCRKPHCVACLNGAKQCFRCAMSASKSPTGSLKAAGTTKLEPPKERRRLNLPPRTLATVGGGLALVAVVGLALAGHHGGGQDGDEKPFLGTSGVSITSPSGKVLHGPQVIKLDVRSRQAVEKVNLTIDGKYWDKWPKDEGGNKFESDWPTGVFKNGTHEVIATVYYRGGRRMAADKKRFVTRNGQ